MITGGEEEEIVVERGESPVGGRWEGDMEADASYNVILILGATQTTLI